MTPRSAGKISVVLAGFALGLIGCFIYFIVQSGCAGDLKAGSLGDPMEALRLESLAFGFLGAGVLTGTVAVAFVPYQTRTQRGISAGAFFVVSVVALWVVAFLLQGQAVQRCFAA